MLGEVVSVFFTAVTISLVTGKCSGFLARQRGAQCSTIVIVPRGRDRL